MTTIALLTTAACTTEEASDPSPTLTTAATTTSTTEAPVQTTEVVETTATPTTEPSTTTTLPPGPTEATVTLLIGGAEGGWLNLGTWNGTAWADAEDDTGAPIAPAVDPGATLTITDLRADRESTAGESVEACFDGRVGPTLDPGVAAPEPPGFGYSAIATSGHDRRLVPRPVAVVDRAPATYQDLGEAIFAGDPVDATLGTVEQVVVADLDGDGDDEAVVAFEYVQPSAGPGAPGDVTALFVVDAASRTPSTVLAGHVPTDVADDAIPVTERFRVIDVADYNGDGRMEVAVHRWYYEGAAVTLYEYDGTSLREALTTGCGS